MNANDGPQAAPADFEQGEPTAAPPTPTAQHTQRPGDRGITNGETYTPDTPWLDQDTTPRPIPEFDSDGNPWRISAEGLHIGTHNGESYCLEWLPVYRRPAGRCGQKEGLEPPAAGPGFEAGQ